MLKKILVVLVVALAAFSVVVAMQPDEFRVTRTATISTSPDVIFPHVNNLHQWEAWSPWAKLDPDQKVTFEGPDAGVGATMRWAGNMSVGEGSMTIIESTAPNAVKFKLDFIKPMPGTNTAEFTFTPDGNETQVTWTMHGPANFMSKAVGLIFNCEKMVGGYFEQGLADLKKISEAKPVVASPPRAPAVASIPAAVTKAAASAQPAAGGE